MADDPATRALAEGQALLDAGRAEDALGPLRHAAALDPVDARAQTLIALAFVQLRRDDEAHDAARAAIALDPEDEWPHRLLAVALTGRGQAREGRDAALTAVRLAPEESRVYLVLAETLVETGDAAGALEAASHGVELAPEMANAHLTLGRVWLHHEEWQEAEAAFRRAIALDPEDADALNNLGVALIRQDRREEGMSLLESAARRDPRSGTVRANIVRIGNAVGRRAMLRLVIVVLVVLAGLLLGGTDGSDDTYMLAAIMLAGALALALVVLRGRRALSDPTRRLMADDARARRFRPHRWDWSWITRLRPWWWILLQRVPAPVALALNAVGFAVVLPGALDASADGGSSPVWAIAFGVGLPFSVLRSWRWWRRRHPARDSWRRPVGTDQAARGSSSDG